MRFSDDFIQKVFEANDLVDLISEVTQLKSASRGLMGRCPFPDHPEKTPSFSVSQAKQVYHCFGCSKSGNIWSFLRDYHGMSFPEAIEFLAGRANISLPVNEANSEDELRAKMKKQIFAANNLALQFFADNLMNSDSEHSVVKYVQKRGLTEETVTTFKMGYSTEDPYSLEKFLLNKGVTTEVAEAAGLLRRSQRGSGHYDPMRGRLMFPILKLSGEVIGFGGRVIEKGEPKYLNSPETQVFSKGKSLFGLDQTARYIRSEDQMVLVEGYMDLIALYQAGIRNVGATLGTAFTLDHGFVVNRLTKNILVLFDGDQAGQNAAERSLPLLLQAGLRPKGLTLDDGLDPDEFIQEYGVEALKNKMEQAPDLFNLIIARWTLSYKGDSTDKLALIEKAQPLFDSIKEARLRELYLNDLANKLQLPISQFKRMMSLGEAPLTRQITNVSATEKKLEQANQQDLGQASMETLFHVSKAPKAERLLVSLAVRDSSMLDSLIQMNLEMNLVDNLQSEDAKKLLRWMLDTYRQNPTIFDRLASLIALKLDDPGILMDAEKLSLSTGDDSDLESQQKVFADCAKKIRADFLKKELEELSRQIKMSPSSDGMAKLQKLQRERLAILKGTEERAD